MLDRLAEKTGELVRLSIVDEDRLTWVAKSQGPRQAGLRYDPIVINPAGLSFRSIPLLDSLKTFDAPIAEVHVTNIHRRDALYQHSLVSLAATGVICGFGAFGYELALHAVAQRLDEESKKPRRPGPTHSHQ